ncbi:MAG: DNA cytosine methyltransferase [Bacteroidetes bacterium]|nr:DNA cytosine methyltransferase [bacterium]NBP65169.1 DNA cytosine methyltransferase [Bacteroidota bacterium]
MSFKAVSLFSGCGGDTLGMERAGGQVVAFSEINKAAIESHLANFPDSVLLTDPTSNASDITKIPDEVFAGYRGTVDVLFAGFPCQGVSNAGKKKATDPRNQMFRQFVRAANAIQPRYIIGENVTGLLTMKSGLSDSDPLLFDVIREEFRKIGYELTHKILEGAQFGVPQKRKRVLIVGWRSEEPFVSTDFWSKVDLWGSQQVMPTMSSFVKPSLADAHPLTADEIPEGFHTYALNAVGDVSGTPHSFVALKVGQKLLSCSKRISPIHSEIVDLTKPSKTIICTYDHQPRLLVGLKRNTDCWVRTFTPDELKQIQGFPANFILRGNKKEQIVQAGNAVPPALVEAVARALFQAS